VPVRCCAHGGRDTHTEKGARQQLQCASLQSMMHAFWAVLLLFVFSVCSAHDSISVLASGDDHDCEVAGAQPSCSHAENAHWFERDTSRDRRPRLWVVSKDNDDHSSRVINRRQSGLYRHPDSSTPVLGRFVAKGTLSGQSPNHLCTASILVRFAYTYEHNESANTAPVGTICSDVLLSTHMLTHAAEGVDVIEDSMRQSMCFSTARSDSGWITYLPSQHKLSTEILIQASCPPHCTAAAVDVRLQSSVLVSDERILPARSHPFTISLICPPVESPKHDAASAAACACEASSCSEWSRQMVGPVFLAPRSVAAETNFSASGARQASSYEVYWAFVNNIAGGITWHNDASAADAHASLTALGDSVFKGCGVCQDGHLLRFSYPLDFVREFKDTFEFLSPELAPASCSEHVFMTLPHKPKSLFIHNMMREDHLNFMNSSAWSMRSCVGTCKCNATPASNSGTSAMFDAAGPMEWKYDADRDVIELPVHDSSKKLHASERSLVFSRIYDVVAKRDPLRPLWSAPTVGADDDDAIIESFLDNSLLPFVWTGESLALSPKTPRIAALVFGELRILTYAFFSAFNSDVIESIGSQAIDIFLVLRPFLRPRCFQGLCSPCSIAQSMLRSVTSCLEYDVPRKSTDDTRRSRDPAGISRAAGAMFSRRWQQHGPYNRFESSNVGSPPGFYQWQPLQLAFSLSLMHERASMSRYSYMLRLRLDKKFPSFLPAVRWNAVLSPSRAYIRGIANSGGRLSERADQTLILGRERVSRCELEWALMRLCSCLNNAFSRRFVRLVSHIAATGLDVTLPGVRDACVPDNIAQSHPNSHSARHGTNAVFSECMVMWALHRSYGVGNVRMLPDWADERHWAGELE
jgi:hypothetical protein